MKGKITAWCFPCKHSVTLDRDIKLVKKVLPNKRIVTIASGYCTGPKCTSRVSTIVSNEKAEPKKRKTATKKRKTVKSKK